ncbi:hypothetical protein HN588_00285 [Candidatus Bathyarchaeota archaeon]|jgi:hypothetical protein|nr:hypothetical protein [Candidatus Bathyarchaeota archaeon]
MDAEKTIASALKKAASGELSNNFGAKDVAEPLSIYAELIEAGHLSGAVARDSHGHPDAIGGAAITIAGREYLKELEKGLASKTLLGFLRSKVGYIVSWAIGVATALLVLWLAKLLGLKA